MENRTDERGTLVAEGVFQAMNHNDACAHETTVFYTDSAHMLRMYGFDLTDNVKIVGDQTIGQYVQIFQVNHRNIRIVFHESSEVSRSNANTGNERASGRFHSLGYACNGFSGFAFLYIDKDGMLNQYKIGTADININYETHALLPGDSFTIHDTIEGGGYIVKKLAEDENKSKVEEQTRPDEPTPSPNDEGDSKPFDEVIPDRSKQ